MNTKQSKKIKGWKVLLSCILAIGIATSPLGSLYALELSYAEESSDAEESSYTEESSESESQTQEETGSIVTLATFGSSTNLYWYENGSAVKTPTYATPDSSITVTFYQGPSTANTTDDPDSDNIDLNDGTWTHYSTATYYNHPTVSASYGWINTSGISLESGYWYYLSAPQFAGYTVTLSGTWSRNWPNVNPFLEITTGYTLTVNYTYSGLDSISVNTDAATTVYSTGDSLDLSGLVVTATYGNGDTKVLDSDDYTIDTSAVNMDLSGRYSVTVSYAEDVEVTNTFDITVNGAGEALAL